jgi:hypothetical protein
MPSIEVAIEMKFHLHRSGQTRWTANMIHDIDAMTVAVPYCDVVVTDHQAFDALTRSDLGTRMNTTILDSPEGLVSLL